MTALRIGTRVLVPAMTALLIFSCATIREKTETYVLSTQGPPVPPIEAWLRTVEIVSNNLPLSADYGLVRDSLAAIASRRGVRLSPVQGGQPWIIDLVVHQHSFTVDLATSSDVMAVLNLNPASGDAASAVRVVYSAVTPDSAVSLYQVTEIAEKVFGSLAASLDAGVVARAKAEADAQRTAAAVPVP